MVTDVVVNLVDTGVGMSTKPWHARCGFRPGPRFLAELRVRAITVCRVLIFFSTQPMLKYLHRQVRRHWKRQIASIAATPR